MTAPSKADPVVLELCGARRGSPRSRVICELPTGHDREHIGRGQRGRMFIWTAAGVAVTTCQLDGCGKPLLALGMCTAHWTRWHRYGDPHKVTTPADRIRPAQERFWEKVNKDAVGGCWEWTGSRSDTGYGNFSLGAGKTGITHRLAYEWLVGKVAADLHLDHLCKNRVCCNPEHLEPVTPVENARRAASIGHDHPNAPRTCKRGHDWSVTPPQAARRSNGTVTRRCRVCANDRRRAAYKRLSAEIAARAVQR